MNEKEKRIRAITKLYYSNPGVQKAIVEFAKDREVVPVFLDIFGKRPDVIQYVSDVNNLAKKGVTSFHASEELWDEPLNLSSELNLRELDELRKGWDLLIDIDSPFLDCSKVAAELIIEAIEFFGIKSYGVKFSGSKGFHIIVPWNSFISDNRETKNKFPEWPRAICEFLMGHIRRDYNKKVGEMLTNTEAIKKRANLTDEEIQEVRCKNCEKTARVGRIVELICPVCGMRIKRKNIKLTKKRLKCLSADCAGVFERINEEKFYYCENCKDPESETLQLGSDKYPENFEKTIGVNAEKFASLDLVLVASRHLFRMPYSLHEKTALASVVLEKHEIENFNPKDADPLKVKVKRFIPESEKGEARKLLMAALEWKKEQDEKEEKFDSKKYKKFEKIEISGVTEDMFPKPIKKLLKGLEDGRKRGLFVLITFLRNTGFSPEEINKKVREWNDKNSLPLKEGYIRSQLDWHLRQGKKILPPNYSNDAFYRDIGILDEKPKTKNPLVDVMRKVRKR